MALVFKSNVTYAGPLPLSKVSQVTMTPAQLYDLYAQRVVNDGGTVIDAAAALAAITYAQENGLLGRLATAFSPAWGVRLTGTDRVLKLYAIDGEDMDGVFIGSGSAADTDLPLHDVSDGDYVVIPNVDSGRKGGFLRSTNPFTLAHDTDNPAAIVTVQTPLDDQSIGHYFGNTPGLSGRFCAVLARSSTQTSVVAQDSTYDPNVSGSGSLLTINGTYGPSDKVATALVLDISSGVATLVNDGNVTGAAVASTGALTNYASLSRYLTVGTGYDGSSNVIASRKGEIRETWALRRATVDEMRAMTAALSSKYA